MPLCFFEAVIRDQGFERIKLVTEPDRSHRCLAQLIRRYDPLVIDHLSQGFATLLGTACSVSTLINVAHEHQIVDDDT